MFKTGDKIRYNVQMSDDKIIRGRGVIHAIHVDRDGHNIYKIHTETGLFFRVYEREIEPEDYPA